MARRGPKHRLKDRSLECELKFRLAGARDHANLRAKLRALGGTHEGAYDEENVRFTGPGKSTRNTSLRLRIVDGGSTGILTAKGEARYLRRIKIREETEVPVGDAHAMRDLLETLGFVVAFTYAKHRSSWRLDGVQVTLDVLDFGWFAEIEGPAERLETVAHALGLDPSAAIPDSYSSMARQALASGLGVVRSSFSGGGP